MENPMKMDDLRVLPFKETPIWKLGKFHADICWWQPEIR